MIPEEIEQAILKKLPGARVRVTGDGHHFVAQVMSAAFEGLSLLKRQQLVYASVNDWIADGRLHALSMKAHTPKEWEALGWTD